MKWIVIWTAALAIALAGIPVHAEVSPEARAALDAISFDTVKTVADKKRAVTATIKADEGGTITATGADGTVYTFVVPARALASDAKITMTPIKSFKGPLGAGPFLGVDFQPEGLRFYEPATLTISNPGTAIEQPMPVQIDKAGDKEEAVTALAQSSVYEITVIHFSDVGVGGKASFPATATITPADALKAFKTSVNQMGAGDLQKTYESLRNSTALIIAEDRSDQLTGKQTRTPEESFVLMGEMLELMEPVAMRLADLQLEGIKAGDIGQMGRVLSTLSELVDLSRRAAQNGHEDIAARIYKVVRDVLEAYVDDMIENCGKYATDINAVLGVMRLAELHVLEAKAERLLDSCKMKQRRATVSAGEMTYAFSNCSNDGSGVWLGKISGGPMKGTGSGVIKGDSHEGEWKGSLKMQGMTLELAGRMKFERASEDAVDPGTFSLTVEAGEGCGDWGCGSNTGTGEWVGATAIVESESCRLAPEE